jgi:hypothetical protein
LLVWHEKSSTSRSAWNFPQYWTSITSYTGNMWLITK